MKKISLTMIMIAGFISVQAQWNNAGFNYTTDRLAIGATAWSGKRLYVVGNDGDHVAMFENPYASGWGVVLRATNDPLRIMPMSGSGPHLFVVNGNGNVGIGTNAPSAKFVVYDPGNTAGTSMVIGDAGYGNTSLIMGTSAQSNGYVKLDAIKTSGGSWGDLILNQNGGNVGIGTTITDAKLTVKGSIHAQEVKVDLLFPGPDYVFDESYALKSLDEVKSFIDENKHLPEVPSAVEMQQNGIDLSEMNMLLLKKVEELTLYLFEQNKKINKQSEQIRKLQQLTNK